MAGRRPKRGPRSGHREGQGSAGDRRGRPQRTRSAPAPAKSSVPCGPGQVVVNGYSDRWLRQGFPWVYPTEVTSRLPAEGTEVQILGPQGNVRGRGLCDSGWLAVRVFRHDEGLLDEEWMHGIVRRAARRREAMIGGDTTAYRLIHGESDGLPGIRVDWWDGWLVVILDSPVLERLVQQLVDALAAEREIKGVYLCHRTDPRDTRSGAGRARWWQGVPPEQDVVIRELGMSMLVRPGDGPDVGSYMDMREVRRWLTRLWPGKRVLNTFAYTGAFSVHAALHGARQTVSVDLSHFYLERARANFEVNGLSVDDHEFVVDDTFRALDRLRRTGERFDVVVLDPPSFSHGPESTWSAKKDMPRLVAAAARVLAEGGILVAASNQGQVSPKAFRGWIADGLRKASRAGAEVAFFGAAPDFPAAVSFPEAHYLKVGVWSLD